MRPRALPVAIAGCVIVSGLMACSEVDQKANTEKVYAGKKDVHAYDNKLFGNDKKKWDASLVQRSRTQNEYLRTDTK